MRKPLRLSHFVMKLIEAGEKLPGYKHAVQSAKLWLEDFGECVWTERESAIDAFERIMKLVEHDSPVYNIAAEEHSALVRAATRRSKSV
jgi:hypothetical protein